VVLTAYLKFTSPFSVRWKIRKTYEREGCNSLDFCEVIPVDHTTKICIMKTTLSFIFFLVTLSVYAQEIKTSEIVFVKKDTTLQRIPGIDNDYRFAINITNQKALKKAKLNVVVDRAKTEMPDKDFVLEFDTLVLGESKRIQDLRIYLLVKKEAIFQGNKKLVLKIQVLDSLGVDITSSISKEVSSMTINIQSDNRLNGYNYLAYVGTNFDLVDGIKAKHFFFATNIFLPPVTTCRVSKPRTSLKHRTGGIKKYRRDQVRSVGIYLSLYGNRTLSTIDSTTNVYRVSGTALSGDTAIAQYNEKVNAIHKRVSDNIGAVFSPLFRLGTASSSDNNVKVYYSPSIEFIWRRVNLDVTYSGATPTDTIFIPAGTAQPNYSAPDHVAINYNEFDFNLGLIGMFITHETNEISVRIGASVGYQGRYTPNRTVDGVFGDIYGTKQDVFFAGRAWITDHDSGITLQAEVSNTVIESRPYYGVTLSKALNFKKMGDLFSPLTAR